MDEKKAADRAQADIATLEVAAMLIALLRKLGILPEGTFREMCVRWRKDLIFMIMLWSIASIPLFFLGFSFAAPPEQLAYKAVFLLVWGGACLWICFLSNRAVKLANGGKMPVITKNPKIIEGVENGDRHVMATSETKYKLLCDWIPIVDPKNGKDAAASIGDLFLYARRPIRFFTWIYALLCIASLLFRHVQRFIHL